MLIIKNNHYLKDIEAHPDVLNFSVIFKPSLSKSDEVFLSLNGVKHAANITPENTPLRPCFYISKVKLRE